MHLCGARHPPVRRIETRLAPFPMLETHRGTYLAAAALHRRCRGKGIAATTVDCLIAAASMEHDCRLLTTDRDFERIAAVSKLRLV